MVELVLSLSKLVIGFLCILGLPALLMTYLHMRDRREPRIYAAVAKVLNLPHLRGLITVRVKSRPLWRDHILIELWNCSQEQVWDVVEKLSGSLPSDVRFQVNCSTTCPGRSTWKLTVKRPHPFFGYCPV